MIVLSQSTLVRNYLRTSWFAFFQLLVFPFLCAISSSDPSDLIDVAFRIEILYMFLLSSFKVIRDSGVLNPVH